MKRAVLFCNGEVSDLSFHRELIRDDDLLIAVDGGAKHLYDLNLVPDIILGDFDSIPPDILETFKKNETECISFPRDKDYIDLVLAIEEARSRGCKQILILGAFGGKRVDMFMANLMAISRYDGCDIVMKNEYSEARLASAGKITEIKGCEGDYVSLIPLDENVETEDSVGLKYPLKDLVFHFGESLGVSNELTEKKASLTVKSGKAMIIRQKRS